MFNHDVFLNYLFVKKLDSGKKINANLMEILAWPRTERSKHPANKIMTLQTKNHETKGKFLLSWNVYRVSTCAQA